MRTDLAKFSLFKFFEVNCLLYESEYSTQRAIIDKGNKTQSNMNKRGFSCGVFIFAIIYALNTGVSCIIVKLPE